MATHLQTFLRENKTLIAGLVIATVVALWFVLQIVRDVIFFNDPRHQDEALKNWMTPRYIAHSYDLPRPVVLEILELEPESANGQRLRTIAEDLGLTLPELTDRVRDAAAAYRATQE